jgi:phosphoglycerate kinase
MRFNRLKDCVVTNKNVILRVDINVPIVNGKIADDTRIRAVIPTIQYLIKNKAKVILISHFGRPDGKKNSSMSLKQLLPRIQELLGSVKVNFVDDCVSEQVKNAVENTKYGEVILLENLRFYYEETSCDPEFSRALASLGNLYVNDAFSCSHRAHASITGIPAILKSCAGFLLEKELDSLENLFKDSAKPLMAMVGGAKVSTKIDLLHSLMKKAQTIAIAGGMANTFLYAIGKNVGKSLCENGLKGVALKILDDAKACKCAILLPCDAVVTKKIEQNAIHKTVSVDDINDDEIIADVGFKTVYEIQEKIKNHKTFVWNGPLGAFEFTPFNLGSEAVAKVATRLTKEKKLVSLAGGGDIVSMLNSCGLSDKFTYISTAGGAFLDWLEGKNLPGVTALFS